MISELVTKLDKERVIEYLIRKKSPYDTQTIYGDLIDYLRDFHSDLTMEQRGEVIERLIGKYVIRNIYKVKLY
jgi:hypothetical protein